MEDVFQANHHRKSGEENTEKVTAEDFIAIVIEQIPDVNFRKIR